MIRERVVRMHVNDDALNFETEAQITAFQNALGHVISYGLRAGINTGVECVELAVDKDSSIAAMFYAPMNVPIACIAADHQKILTLDASLKDIKGARLASIFALRNKSDMYEYRQE
jgi:hypothetical protein